MRLYVNIDHVATLREARRTDEPDPVRAAAAAERAGADGITVHLREDRRHIQDADVRALAASARTALHLALAASRCTPDTASRTRMCSPSPPFPTSKSSTSDTRSSATRSSGEWKRRCAVCGSWSMRPEKLSLVAP